MDGDAGAEGGVDGGVEVCGEEDDALEVFEFAEEDCGKGLGGVVGEKGGGGVVRLTRYEFVSYDVFWRTFCHEDVGLWV